MTERKAFSRLLKEALEDASGLREKIEALSGEILTGEPARIFQAASCLEGHVESGRAVLERLIAVLSRAHLHTLGSAYEALRAAKGREADAEDMLRLISEYRQAKAIMRMATRHVDTAMASLSNAMPKAGLASTREPNEKRPGALLAKA
ncbi:MAG TPA: hypothetical protein VMA37_14270 [Acetobacteraceae bacterium]|nr:hypothetical protein [Acetobacteraceae bacterium]